MSNTRRDYGPEGGNLLNGCLTAFIIICILTAAVILIITR